MVFKGRFLVLFFCVGIQPLMADITIKNKTGERVILIAHFAPHTNPPVTSLTPVLDTTNVRSARYKFAKSEYDQESTKIIPETVTMRDGIRYYLYEVSVELPEFCLPRKGIRIPNIQFLNAPEKKYELTYHITGDSMGGILSVFFLGKRSQLIGVRRTTECEYL